jgi:hypothetical protein
MAPHPLYTRRSTLSQSTTRFIGMDVHPDPSAMASMAQDHGAEGSSRGRSGIRQCALVPRVCKMPSQAKHLLCVSDAGPGGAWL